MTRHTLGLLVVFGVVQGVESNRNVGVSRRVSLEGPGDLGAKSCEVIQILDSTGEPGEYSMVVDSVVCKEAKCEILPVRLFFDAVGNYERYELPPGRNLTKLGHQPFSPADHEKLHQILSDPYSQLKSIQWNQITLPTESASKTRSGDYDAISGATALSKRSMVVVGAAYTCFTLWHWSHGAVRNVIREMTIRASDKQDWLRYVQGPKEPYVVFGLEQLAAQKQFDPETITAVVEVMRRGSLRVVDPALSYLAKASRETKTDHFFRCAEDDGLAAQPEKRVRFLEALRDGNHKLPADCLDRLSTWLGRAGSYYEVHLLLTLLERHQVASDRATNQALALLGSTDALIVRRSYRYLKAQKLSPSLQKKLEAFEQQNPDP